MTLRFPATLSHQRDVAVYSFTVSAVDLPGMSRVTRFGVDPEGVNRVYYESHALKIAEAMLKPGTVMLDSICGDLCGPWRYENGILIPEEGAYLSIDDGQHRRGACEVLTEVERARWEFPVVATQGLDLETRLRIFRQQSFRKPINRRLDLAMRWELDDWNTDAERQAYALILNLQSDEESPLRGMIVLEETVSQSYKRQHRTAGINANGLWATLKSVMSKGSPLYSLPLAKRSEVAYNMIMAAAQVWSRAWDSDDHVLRTARGINSVLMLMVSGPHFRGVVGDDFRFESLHAALSLIPRFNWTQKSRKNKGQREITVDLDKAIDNARQQRLTSGEEKIVA